MAKPKKNHSGGSKPDAAGDSDLAFGPFVLQRTAKQLWEGDRPIRVGGRAFDLLTLLVERAGQVVGKAELMACAWPNTVVEDINLRVHVAALRKALGDGQHAVRYIASVAGQGYAFVCPVAVIRCTLSASEVAPRRRHNLPATLTRLLGRDDQLKRAEALLGKHRFVSIVGPAGIGKTALGLRVASSMVEKFEHGVWLVELANLSDPGYLVASVAESVGFSLPADDALRSLSVFLRPRSTLLLLDNCEHIAAVVAELAVSLLRSAPGLHLLLTSREQIRAEGEWMLRVPTLGLPIEGSPTVAQSLRAPAVQLFVERAIANQDSFELTPANVGLVVEMCRKLDGLPVAIELAAARVDTFGVAGTLKLIEEHSRLLSSSSRALLPRHRAMSALLDWDYQLLTPSEQALFSRLSSFRGAFRADWAFAVAAVDPKDAGESPVLDVIASLTSKSLLMAQAGEDEVEFRMLQTTRDYAYGKLLSGGDVNDTRRCHAQLFRDFFANFNGEHRGQGAVDWHALHERCMDDVRFALDWAFGPAGDLVLAIDLTLQTLEMCLQVGLLEESRKRLATAVTLLPACENIDHALSIRLQVAHASIWLRTQSNSLSYSSSSLTSVDTKALADVQKEPEQAAELACAMWFSAVSTGDYPASMSWARNMMALAEKTGDLGQALFGDRMAATAQFYLGEFAESSERVERVLGKEVEQTRLDTKGWRPPDRKVSLGIVKSRILWITGFPDQALELAQEVVLLARADVPHALGQAICMAAAPIAFWNGDDMAARRLIDEGLAQAADHRMAYWRDWMQRYDLLLRWRIPKTFDDGLPELSIESAQQSDFFCTIDAALLDDLTVQRVERGLVGWCAAEVHRAGALSLLKHSDDAAIERATSLLNRSMEVARAQGAFAWELRAATTAAQVCLHRGSRDLAFGCLAPVFDRVKEGVQSADVRSARALLDALEGRAFAVDLNDISVERRRPSTRIIGNA